MSRQQMGWVVLCFLLAMEAWCGLMMVVNGIHGRWDYAVGFALLGAANGGNANFTHRTLKRG